MQPNEIINKSLPAAIQGKTAEEGVAFYIATLWRTIVIVGAIGFLIYLLWGGVEYLTSGGNAEKAKEATHRISSALIGLAILAGSYAIIKFIEAILQISILNPVFEKNL